MKIIWSIIILTGGLYCAFCLFLFLMQAKLIYYPNIPSRELTASPNDIGLEYESLSIKTSDRIILHGWFVPASDERGVVLFFHGNAGNISHRLDSLKIFNKLGLSTLIIDYRGYGKSQGQLSEQGTYLDAEAAWNYLTMEKNIPARKIVVFGRSLGAAIAANCAAKHTPGALILESAFTSVPDMAARLYPIFPVRLLSRFLYSTKKALLSVNSPVLIVHSPDDEIIPFENGQQLYRSAREPKTMLEIRGGHNDGFLISGEMYIDGIRNFLQSIL
ncbi:MAG: alpha/beta hydrolase [Deltaproteobacteria bacterium]|nr:alpha/beta hydrolase [Deltaproteobacteria bacterium]